MSLSHPLPSFKVEKGGGKRAPIYVVIRHDPLDITIRINLSKMLVGLPPAQLEELIMQGELIRANRRGQVGIAR